MNRNADLTPAGPVRRVSYPWLSVLGGVLAVAYLLLLAEPEWAALLDLPTEWFREEVRYAVAGGFTLLLLFDLHRHRRQSVRQREDLLALRHHVDALWESKKRLQLKAHTYSSHADKLKLFISDKLLEYIEYDEKFLHFKSIAAEVRHNGVISFDKVQTALHQALAAAEAAAPQPEGADGDPAADYRAALDAMRYLWDLLDLSTAENLALHIGNLLCECEEQYYQRLLHGEDAAKAPRESTEPPPCDPAYSPQRAALRALELAVHKPLPPPAEGEAYTLDNGRWRVHLEPAGALLGNENHYVLLLENLLKNAQFFSGKRGYKAPFAPIAVRLTEEEGQAVLRVYNRGPHIRDEDRPNLFQLGFSTRRTREQHGRGLGLYFVDQIVRGYEGRITVHNVRTPETRYTVRLALESGEVITDCVDVALDDGKPHCRTAGGEPAPMREWTFKSPLRGVEITPDGDPETRRLEGFAAKGRQSRFDPYRPEHPPWWLHYQPKRNAHRIAFEPLEIGGVDFEVRLPTAEQRLASSELAHDDDIDAEVERLDEQFRARADL